MDVEGRLFETRPTLSFSNSAINSSIGSTRMKDDGSAIYSNSTMEAKAGAAKRKRKTGRQTWKEDVQPARAIEPVRWREYLMCCAKSLVVHRLVYMKYDS